MRLLQVARLSKSRDGSTALDKQDEKCQKYASAYDHTIIGVSSDSDISGKSDPFTRPELGAWLMRPDHMCLYDGLIASHLDRLGRSTKHWQRLLNWAAEHGKVIITVEPAIDFSSPTGQLVGYIMSWLAEQELNLITKRISDTRRFLIANDFLSGKAPFGFKSVTKGEHKTLEINPVEADILRQAVSRYLRGNSLQQICAWLESTGMKTHDGRTHWAVNPVAKIFHNPILIGRYMNADRTKTLLKVEPIIDKKTWDKLQAELNRKALRKGIASSETAMLTSVAYCGKCGSPMYRAKSKNNFYYRCNARPNQACLPMAPLPKVDAYVNMMLSTGPLSLAKVVETIITPGHDYADEIAEIEQDIRELDLDDLVRRDELMTERQQLKGLDKVPGKVIKQETEETVGQRWLGLSRAERRQYLLDAGLTVMVYDKDNFLLYGPHPNEVSTTLANELQDRNRSGSQ